MTFVLSSFVGLLTVIVYLITLPFFTTVPGIGSELLTAVMPSPTLTGSGSLLLSSVQLSLDALATFLRFLSTSVLRSKCTSYVTVYLSPFVRLDSGSFLFSALCPARSGGVMKKPLYTLPLEPLSRSNPVCTMSMPQSLVMSSPFFATLMEYLSMVIPVRSNWSLMMQPVAVDFSTGFVTVSV